MNIKEMMITYHEHTKVATWDKLAINPWEPGGVAGTWLHTSQMPLR